MIDVLVWNKYTRVVMQLAERLNISPEKALHLFYNSKVSVSKSGNKLTISSAKAFDGTVRITATRNNMPWNGLTAYSQK